MKNTKLTEYVERYLDGKLKDGDLWEFKVNLEKDKELARELKLQQELREMLIDTDKMQVRNTINEIFSKSTNINLFSQKWKLQAIAAAVVIMMLVGGGLLFNHMQSPGSSNMAIYEEYFNVDEELFTVRAGGEVNNSNALTKGLEAYNNSDFETALSLFNKNSDNMAAKLYAGFSYMELEKFDKAEITFKEIITNNNNLFIDQAEFNLALCYVATDNLADAKLLLTTIINGKTAYSSKAQELLRDIERQ